MRQLSLSAFALVAAAIAVVASSSASPYPAGMGSNWMSPEIEGLVNSTDYNERYVVYGQYDEDEDKWSKLSFTEAGGSNDSPRVPVTEVLMNKDAKPHNWHMLKFTSIDPRDPFFTTGFAEGARTFQQIFDFHMNAVAPVRKAFYSDELNSKFFKKQYDRLINHETETALGKQIHEIVRQTEGMWAGWKFAFDAANAPSEMEDIDKAAIFFQSYFADALIIANDNEFVPRSVESRKPKRPTHCTVINKIIDGELTVSHAALSDYNFMIRQYKSYYFPGGRNITMTGYPGVVTSLDDFIMTGNDLLITTTALLTYNDTDDTLIDPTKVPGFVAMMAASYIAKSPLEFAQTLTGLVPGSLQATIMIADTKAAYTAYKQKTALPNGTFYVAEIIPAFSIYKDVTPVLNRDGHMLSFDIAYFPETQAMTMSDLPATLKREYDLPSYDHSPIAVADRRDLPFIVNATTMFYAIRHNNFPNDPALANPRCIGQTIGGNIPCDNITLVGPNVNNTNPGLGAAPRYDLAYNTFDGAPAAGTGAADGKATTMSMIQEGGGRAIIAQVGPTHVQQKPFSFSAFARDFPAPRGTPMPPMRGMPDTFDFPPAILRGDLGYRAPTAGSSSPTSAGAKAGVAVAVIVGAFALVGLGLVVRQRRASQRVLNDVDENSNLV